MGKLLRYGRRFWQARRAHGPADDPDFRSGLEYFSALGITSVGTLVDVGANEGQFLFPALRFLAPKRALAVEMLPELAQQLERRVPAGVTVYSCAVGAAAGQAPCLRSAYSPASSLLPLVPEASQLYNKNLRQTASEIVAIRTLDDICSEAGFEEIDLLKIDVQGYEMEVLRGAGRMLKSTWRIIIEVEFVPVYQGAPLFPTVYQELQKQGFVLSQIFGQCRSQEGVLLHADALFQAQGTAGS